MIEQHSRTWCYLVTHMKQRIEDLKNDLCSPRIKPEDAQVKRGRIQAYREILDLPQENKKYGE